MLDETTKKLLETVVANWRSGVTVGAMTALKPDASLRRYYRIALAGADCPATVVAMVFDSVVCPEVEGVKSVMSDVAYVELGKFFRAHGVSVPELYFDARDEAVLLIEDCGDEFLASAVIGADKDRYTEADRDALFKAAIEQIVRIQRAPVDKDFFAFRRSMSGAVYRKEIQEFRDYVVPDLAEKKLECIETLFDVLSDELESRPKVLSHRDFHAWNLHVLEQQQIRVIDFQDALLATQSYDVISFLNDRDMDTALGRERYCMLANYFYKQARCETDFWDEFDRALLQRDLKVSGRFSKLVSTRGLESYRKWIPGTLRRIGRTLERISSDSGADPAYSEFLSLLVDDATGLPEIREGVETPLRLRSA